jgi:tRNA (cytidine/uridine-2'-O-)-methyltransferase
MIHIVLLKPEKPLNVGNIMRTCVAFGTKLHIIGPLTYELNDKSIKRAGLDYYYLLKWQYYENYDNFNEINNNPKLFCLSRYGKKIYSDESFENRNKDYFILFGSESKGIDEEILKAHQDRVLRIPMKVDVRSMNLANTVAIAIYEIMRQQQFKGLSLKETIKQY